MDNSVSHVIHVKLNTCKLAAATKTNYWFQTHKYAPCKSQYAILHGNTCNKSDSLGLSYYSNAILFATLVSEYSWSCLDSSIQSGIQPHFCELFSQYASNYMQLFWFLAGPGSSQSGYFSTVHAYLPVQYGII